MVSGEGDVGGGAQCEGVGSSSTANLLFVTKTVSRSKLLVDIGVPGRGEVVGSLNSELSYTVGSHIHTVGAAPASRWRGHTA